MLLFVHCFVILSFLVLCSSSLGSETWVYFTSYSHLSLSPGAVEYSVACD